MAIKFDGRTYKLRVKPGADGLREFQAQVRQLLGFNITDDFDVTFECQIPHSGERMKLTGLSSYGAATHCAAITAAQRDVARAAHRERANLRASAGHLQASAAPAGASAPVGPSSSPADLPPYVRSDSGSRLNLRPLDGGASSSLPPLPPAFLSLPLPRPSTVPQASPRPNTSMPRPATMSPRPVISTPLAPLASPRSTAISPRARHVALAPSPAPPSSATTAALLLAAAAPQGVTVSAEVVCEEASMRGLFKGLVERTKVQLHKMLH